jgi:hypothetical protein
MAIAPHAPGCVTKRACVTAEVIGRGCFPSTGELIAQAAPRAHGPLLDLNAARSGSVASCPGKAQNRKLLAASSELPDSLRPGDVLATRERTTL